MIARILLPVFAGAAAAFSQNVPETPAFDPVAEAVREFNQRRAPSANEVTVVLDPPASEPTPSGEVQPAPEPEPPPSGAPGTSRRTSRKAGLSVKVEKIQSGNGAIDLSKVKLLAPFSAKPLLQPPPGWRIDSSVNAPPLTREVELAPGAAITLTIRPHLLTPEADGSDTFSISEPGYHPMLGYRQTDTVGAILSTSIQQLDDDAKHLGQAIDRLQQLLSSLPRPESPPSDAR